MRNYVIRRLILMIPTLFVVTVVVFLLIRMMPGNVIELMVMEHSQEQAGEVNLDVAAVEAMLGLDKPWYVQYREWIGNLLQGDLGLSLWTERSVNEDIAARLPITFELGFLSFLIAQLVAFPIGIYSAIRQETLGDYLGRAFAILSLATPAFWLATMLMVFPSIWWGWSPAAVYIPLVENPGGNLIQFTIPAILLGTAMSATTMRMLRTTMLEVLRQDYVRTAWSKGLKERIVIIRHGLRNAMIPVITIISGQIPIMIGGTVIIEQIFALPGMGRLFLEAIVTRDYPYISALNLILAVVGLLLILLCDLSYAWLDPRVRYK